MPWLPGYTYITYESTTGALSRLSHRVLVACASLMLAAPLTGRA